MEVTTFHTHLIKKEKNSADALNFYFEKPRKFTYLAGQYVKLWMDIKNPDVRGKTHYFTLSSSPNDKYLMVTTRILRSTFKLKMGSLKLGAKVKMRGPWGDFVIDEKSKKHLVFIAGGIGMTPFHSMLRFASTMHLKIPIILFVSYKTPDQILYKEELEDIARSHKNIKIITTITEPEGTDWKGITGRITTEFLQKHLDKLSGNTYYIAGPDPMVESMEKQLLGMKISKKQILSDGFPGY